MNKVLRPLRRAAVYGAFSYLGLVVINNSGLDLPSLWIAYLPMFVGVYALTIWIESKVEHDFLIKLSPCINIYLPYLFSRLI